jgi:hypothetical protein
MAKLAILLRSWAQGWACGMAVFGEMSFLHIIARSPAVSHESRVERLADRSGMGGTGE